MCLISYNVNVFLHGDRKKFLKTTIKIVYIKEYENVAKTLTNENT